MAVACDPLLSALRATAFKVSEIGWRKGAPAHAALFNRLALLRLLAKHGLEPWYVMIADHGLDPWQ